jgi:hypothetical protein
MGRCWILWTLVGLFALNDSSQATTGQCPEGWVIDESNSQLNMTTINDGKYIKCLSIGEPSSRNWIDSQVYCLGKGGDLPMPTLNSDLSGKPLNGIT